MKNRFASLFLLLLSTIFPLLSKEPPTVLVSLAPYKFFVEKIADGTVSVLLMVPAGASAHTYEPTAKQMILASNGDIWFTIGESFETKAIPAIRSQDPNLQTVDLRQGVDLIISDPQSGACCCNTNCQDPHIWMSPRQAKIQVNTIASTLKQRYPTHASLYEKNLTVLLDQLEALDLAITRELAPVKNRTILVSHPSYAYFCRDYNLKQLSIEFEGKDPTPRQLTQILNQARQEHIRKVFVQPQYSRKGANLFAKELGATVIVLDPYSEEYFDSMNKIAHAIAE